MTIGFIQVYMEGMEIHAKTNFVCQKHILNIFHLRYFLNKKGVYLFLKYGKEDRAEREKIFLWMFDTKKKFL